MIVNTQIAYFLNSLWSGKFIDYPMREQISDILPSFFLGITMGGIIFFLGLILSLSDLQELIIQLFVGAFLTFFIAELFRLDAYLYIKKTVREKLCKPP